MKVTTALNRRAIRDMPTLAGICGVTKQAVWKWLHKRGNSIPDEHIPKVRQFLSQGGG